MSINTSNRPMRRRTLLSRTRFLTTSALVCGAAFCFGQPVTAQFMSIEVPTPVGLTKVTRPALTSFGGALQLSGDGTTAIGNAAVIELEHIGFWGYRWTAAEGASFLNLIFSTSPDSREGTMNRLGSFYQFAAYGLNDDGSVIAGQTVPLALSEAGLIRDGELRPRAGFWEDGKVVILDKDPDEYSISGSIALDVSDDGTKFVGSSSTYRGRQALLWAKDGTPTNLGHLASESDPIFRDSWAQAISGNGTYVTGASTTTDGFRAFRWSDSTGMVDLGVLNPAAAVTSRTSLYASERQSYGNDISDDGSIVVGYSTNGSFNEAFKWTEETGMVGLGALEGAQSRLTSAEPEIFRESDALAISGNGDVIVGNSMGSQGYEAVRWTDDKGLEKLEDIMAANDVDLGILQLVNAQDVSDDGTIILVQGSVNEEDMPEVSSRSYFGPDAGDYLVVIRDTDEGTVAGVVNPEGMDDSAKSVSQTSRGAAGSGRVIDQSLVFAGLNYRLPTRTGGRQRAGAAPRMEWGAFTFGQGARGLSSTQGTSTRGFAGAGVMSESSDGFRIGLAAVATRFNTRNGTLGSSSSISGTGAGFFATYAPAPTGLELSAVGSVQTMGATINRNYLNGATIETATGSTSGRYYGGKIQVGYGYALGEKTIVKPFVGYDISRALFDGYTETGGVFAGTVGAQNAKLSNTKIGVEGRFTLSPRTTLTGKLTYSSAIETGSNAAIRVGALNGMSFGGGAGNRRYTAAELQIGVNHDLSEKMRVYGSIDTTRALTSTARDIDSVNVNIGLSVRF